MQLELWQFIAGLMTILVSLGFIYGKLITRVDHDHSLLVEHQRKIDSCQLIHVMTEEKCQAKHFEYDRLTQLQLENQRKIIDQIVYDRKSDEVRWRDLTSKIDVLIGKSDRTRKYDNSSAN